MSSMCLTMAAKWSLTGDQARAVYGVKMGHPTFSTIGALRFATVYSEDFQRADTFARFLDVNGIEIVD